MVDNKIMESELIFCRSIAIKMGFKKSVIDFLVANFKMLSPPRATSSYLPRFFSVITFEMQPKDLHQRVPFFVGSKNMVERAEGFFRIKPETSAQLLHDFVDLLKNVFRDWV